MAISNRDSRVYTTGRRPFVNNNKTLFASYNKHGAYCVYSYSVSWPLYVYTDGQWYRNVSKYSKTTTTHLGYARPDLPYGDAFVDLNRQNISFLVEHGLAKFIAHKIADGGSNDY
jgi:hypothetical protein